MGGMCNPQPWYPTLRQNICIVLIEIAFGTVCDSSLQCGCFGLLMIQVAHSEGGKSSRTWVSICAMTFFWYDRSRSKARSLHEKKLLLRKLPHGHRWSHAAWQIIKTKTKTTKNKRQDADPPARQQSKQRTGQEQQKQPQKICQGHSGKNPLSQLTQKLAANELVATQ